MEGWKDGGRTKGFDDDNVVVVVVVGPRAT